MRVKRTVGLVVLTALLLSGLPADVAAQTEWPNCENFLDQDDAQAAYDADRGDPFDLESSQSPSTTCLAKTNETLECNR